jgi:hypothetical protein
MKLNLIAMALAATAFGAIVAQADELVIKEKTGSNGVVIKERVGAPRAKVVIKEREPSLVVRKRVTTGVSTNCSTRTVAKTNENTDRTKIKTTTRC